MIDIHQKKKLIIYLGIILLIFIWGVSFFDKGLAVGLFLLVFLSFLTFLVLFKFGIKDKKLYLLILVTLFIHLAAVLFIYYTGFRPFGGGADYEGYNKTAIELAQRLKKGFFSLEGLYSNHYFPVVIGVIYFFTLPEMIVGQLFTVFLAILAIIFIYLIVQEIGGSEKWAFFTGLMVSFYPSYIYFGSLLLKDTLIIPLVLAGLLLFIKMMKGFSWRHFLIFYFVLTILIHFRFYIGYALMFSFILCWFLISNLKIQKRIIYGLVIIFLLGFSPQFLGYGYYGVIPLNNYLNKETITTYREIVYAPTPPAPSATPPSANAPSGTGSSFVVKAGFDSTFNFIKNYFLSFSYALLGPLPWQLVERQHYFSLIETIPWYFLIIISFYGFIKLIKKQGFLKTIKNYKITLPLLMFGLMALGALSLFINNYGIIVRIRIPVFISFLCIMAFNFKNSEKYLSNSYEKIFSHWRSRFYRQSSR